VPNGLSRRFRRAGREDGVFDYPSVLTYVTRGVQTSPKEATAYLARLFAFASHSAQLLPFSEGGSLSSALSSRGKAHFPKPLSVPVSVRAHSVTFSMALLQYQAPVDYAAQLDAFKDFLQHFKTLQSTSEAAATEAMEDLNIDGDRTSDEYDFMDDVDDEGAGTRGASRRREPKLKYMQILQDIANREVSNIVIELDDLDVVSVNKNSVAFTIDADKDYL
jgi:hypothetical protein